MGIFGGACRKQAPGDLVKAQAVNLLAVVRPMHLRSEVPVHVPCANANLQHIVSPGQHMQMKLCASPLAATHIVNTECRRRATRTARPHT